MLTVLPEVARGARLSPPQRRLWQLQQAYAGVEFGAQAHVRIGGDLDPAQLRAAVARVTARHEILRTRLGRLASGGAAVQVPADVSGLDGTRGAWAPAPQTGPAELERVAREHWRALGDPLAAPPCVFALVRTRPGEHVLVVTAAGWCADGVGLVNVVREIARECAQPGAAAEEVLQYAELAEWQNQLVEQAPPDQPPPYWQAREFEEASHPCLPFERRAAPSTPPCFDTLRRAWPRRAGAPLGAGAASHAHWLAAWALVLQRLCRQASVLLGVVHDGRPDEELQAALGPLARVVPLRLDVADGVPFASLREQARAALDAAHDEQLGDTWADLGRPGLAARRHLFPVQFGVRATPGPETFGRLEWRFDALVERLEPCDLALTVVPSGSDLDVELTWDARRFARSDVEHVADLYLRTLDAAAVQPACRVAGFVLGAAADVPAAPEPAARPWRAVHEQIAEQARRVPQRPAVACGARWLTYAELDGRAARLARRLRAAGTRRGDVVALVAERAPEFFVGLLAVLRAGAAWLPIEPDTPAARRASLLAQAGVRVVLVGPGVTPDGMPGGVSAFALDDGEAPAVADVDDDGACAVEPRDLAYVIFTSGSTGQPKGVAIEHGQLAAYLHGIRAGLELPDGARHALVSTVAADLGHTPVFAALTSGGCLEVIPAWLASDADALAEHLQRRPVELLKIVPAHLEALCASFPESLRLGWRYVIAGGEQLSWDVVERVERLAPGVKVINEYGPTETTVGVLWAHAERAREPFCGGAVPVGHALAGVTGHVLDGHLRPLPAWLAGEFFIGGDLVGRGYVRRGDLTAERFLPDPWSARPGGRMYRTGDLVRRRGDGTLEFLGRRDGQVKIRGYRVELGEIEASLGAHPAVRSVAVLVADGPAGARQLVAWAAVGAAEVEPEELTRFLAARLPHFMLPARIVCVERLALTANGKVDRQALPALAPPALAAAPNGPADELEHSLLSVWRQVLGNERIGVEDDYFALGGDSMRVIQLVHEARRFGITFAAHDVLRHPTIRRLRQALRERQRHELFPQGVPALELPEAPLPPDVEDAYPLTGIQRFMLDAYARNEGARGVYHAQESLGFSDDSFSPQAVEQTLRLLVQRHRALRTVFDLDGDPPMQWVLREPRWALDVRDITTLDVSEQDDYLLAYLRADRARLFDPRERDVPLFRMALLVRSARDFDVVISAHHAIVDGWGQRVLTNQFAQAYAEVKAGRRPELGAPDSAQREFAAYQEAVRRAPRAVSFWQRYLDGVEPWRLEPCARVEPETDEPLVLGTLGVELARGLTQIARRERLALQALLLAAWVETLRADAGQEPVVTGIVTNGRSEYLSDPLAAVGLFWNIVPVVARRALPLVEQALRLQADLVEMQPYVAYPLPQLMADQGGRLPFDTVFRYLHFWNVENVPAESGLELRDIVAYDRYSFPLDALVLFHSRNDDAHLLVQYDPRVVSRERAQAVFERYGQTLRRIVDVA